MSETDDIVMSLLASSHSRRTSPLVLALCLASACSGASGGDAAAPAPIVPEAAALCGAYFAATPGSCPACSQSIRVLLENDVSGAYRLVGMRVLMDGMPMCEAATDSMGEFKAIPAGVALTPPGDHTIDVQLEYAGNGYGVFAYLKGYRFNVRSRHTLEHPEESTVTVRAIAKESGGVAMQLEDRLTLHFVEESSWQAR